MLTNLRLQNFKGWPDTGPIPLKPITALFGPNGSGKTALIQAILLLKQTADSKDPGQVLDFGSPNTLADLGNFKSIVHRHNTRNPLKISLDWKSRHPFTVTEWDKTIAESEHIGFDVTVGLDEISLTQPSVKQMAYRVGPSKLGMASIPSWNSYSLFFDGVESGLMDGIRQYDAFPPPLKCYGFPRQVYAQFANSGLTANFELELEKRLNDIYYLGPLRAHPQRVYSWSGNYPANVGSAGESAVQAILASQQRRDEIGQARAMSNRTLERYIAGWLKDIGLIRNFKIVPVAEDRGLFEVRVLQHNYGTEALLTDVGFGVSQVLPVLTQCFYAPPGSTVILEQPEIHLHPFAQSALADIIIDAYQTREVQILLESHSEHLLNRLQRRIAEEKITSDEVSLFFCQPKDGDCNLETLELDEYGNIKNWPKNFFGDQFGEINAMADAIMERRIKAQ